MKKLLLKRDQFLKIWNLLLGMTRNVIIEDWSSRNCLFSNSFHLAWSKNHQAWKQGSRMQNNKHTFSTKKIDISHSLHGDQNHGEKHPSYEKYEVDVFHAMLLSTLYVTKCVGFDFFDPIRKADHQGIISSHTVQSQMTTSTGTSNHFYCMNNELSHTFQS